eukprot:2066046-Alexandrium_andersonii.AAC.1
MGPPGLKPAWACNKLSPITYQRLRAQLVAPSPASPLQRRKNRFDHEKLGGAFATAAFAAGA